MGLLVLLSVPFARHAPAHPHVWIISDVALVMRDGAIRAMHVSWTFDEMFSALMMEDYDSDDDGALSEAEFAAITESQGERSLASYGYFTHVELGNEPLVIETVDDFRVEVVGYNVRVSFTVPMPSPVDPAVTPFSVSLYDPTYYVDISIGLLEPVRFVGGEPSGCRPGVTYETGHPRVFGRDPPLRVELRCAAS